MPKRNRTMIEQENIPYTQEECAAMSRTIQRLREQLSGYNKPSRLILREQAAIAALQSLIVGAAIVRKGGGYEELADRAVDIADALVEKLNAKR